MKESFNQMNTVLRNTIPPVIYDSAPLVWFRGWLWSYVTFDRPGDDKKNDDK